ncbi:MAG: guanylate kinase, partial [Nitrospinae bacterium]|nr:guanylate kinase [Nitrospinota bacterium]
MNNKGIAFILSAPSGTGKTTTCKLLRKKLPKLKFSVSHTTRAIRDGETEGVDYHFIPQKEFEEKIDRDEFLEWAKVHNQYYGTAFETVDRHRQKGEDLLLELDVQGVQSLRK